MLVYLCDVLWSLDCVWLSTLGVKGERYSGMRVSSPQVAPLFVLS